MKILKALMGEFKIEPNIKEIKIVIPVDALIYACESREDYQNPKIIDKVLFIELMSKQILNGEPPNNDRDGRTRLEMLLDSCFEDVYSNGTTAIKYF